jgi:GNAT superfamily N-acetyltransferase
MAADITHLNIGDARSNINRLRRSSRIPYEVVIRKGRREDMELIMPNLIDGARMHLRQEADLFNPDEFTRHKMSKYYLDSIKNKNGSFFVAEVNGRIAGHIKVDFEIIPAIFKNNEILYIDDLYVAPKFRNSGVARSLVHAAEKFARAKGIKRVQGRIYTFNMPAQKLMRSIGYNTPHVTVDKVLS